MKIMITKAMTAQMICKAMGTLHEAVLGSRNLKPKVTQYANAIPPAIETPADIMSTVPRRYALVHSACHAGIVAQLNPRPKPEMNRPAKS